MKKLEYPAMIKFLQLKGIRTTYAPFFAIVKILSAEFKRDLISIAIIGRPDVPNDQQSLRPPITLKKSKEWYLKTGESNLEI